MIKCLKLLIIFSSLIFLGHVSAVSAASDETANTKRAVFAGGCFWCVDQVYSETEGIISTTAGFSGGHVANPNYDQVSAGGTGHIEVVEVIYDPHQVDYATLLHVFWRNIDPFNEEGQFCDEGDTYRSAIFVLDEEQRALAEATRDDVAEQFDRPIATEILDFEAFYPAEDYHQNYYRKNPLRYNFYKATCGRKNRLEQVWGDEAGGREVEHLSQR